MVRAFHRLLEKFASKFAQIVGTSYAFLLALILGLAWFSMHEQKEMFGISRISIVEFANMFMFMHLFLIQRTQNKNVKAIHLKLDELIASKEGANNDLIKAERSSEEKLDELHDRYVDLAAAPKDSTAAVTFDTDSNEKDVRRVS